jgi:hypothetical protein
MMVCNDLSLANEALIELTKDQSGSRKQREIGAKIYFVRIQLAHFYEGLKAIEAIREDPFLLSVLKASDEQTQCSFKNLEQYLKNGSKYDEFEKMVGRVRNDLTFHYDNSGKLIERDLNDWSTNHKSQFSIITRGDAPYFWYFKVADDIVDSIIVRQIWKISKNADARVEADKVLVQLHKIFLSFLDFSGEFIWNYFKN